VLWESSDRRKDARPANLPFRGKIEEAEMDRRRYSGRKGGIPFLPEKSKAPEKKRAIQRKQGKETINEKKRSKDYEGQPGGKRISFFQRMRKWKKKGQKNLHAQITPPSRATKERTRRVKGRKEWLISE